MKALAHPRPLPASECTASSGDLEAVRPHAKSRPHDRPVFLLLALFVACAPIDLLLLHNGAAEAAWAVMVVGLACAVAIAVQTIRLERERHARTAEAEKLHAAAFQHASTSIWVENWTEVGRVVLAVREAGGDLASHLRTTPGLLRRLHESVVITDVNEFTLSLLGIENKARLIGRLADVVPNSAETFDGWMASFARGDRFHRSESRVRRSDGTVRDCLVTAALPTDADGFGRLLVSILDVTDYKADQARLRSAERDVARASRLLAMGTLTASIAHEVNNPLAAVITNAEASLRWLRRPNPDLAEVDAAVTGAIEAARRATAVVDRTRRLVTEAPHKPAAIDVAEAIRGTLPLLSREMRESRIDVRVGIAAGTPPVLADAIQLQQVLVNLLLNAVRAMEDTDGARFLTVTAQPDGEGVRVDVSDTGTGIAPEHEAHLFDPFYSTRPDGMGLGLAVCRACVEAHGGRLWLTNRSGGGRPGAGATFHFTLPTLPPAVDNPS